MNGGLSLNEGLQQLSHAPEGILESGPSVSGVVKQIVLRLAQVYHLAMSEHGSLWNPDSQMLLQASLTAEAIPGDNGGAEGVGGGAGGAGANVSEQHPSQLLHSKMLVMVAHE